MLHKRRLRWLNSIKNKMLLYLVVNFALISVVVVLSNLSNWGFIDQYNIAFVQYNQLNLFYENVEAAGDHIKSSFYSASQEDYEQYAASIGKAKGNLRTIASSTGDEEIVWRIGRLGNMVDTFDETVNALRTMRTADYAAYSEKYDYMVRLIDLIDRTAVTYSNLITNQMRQQRDLMVQQWKSQGYWIAGIFAAMLLLAVVFSVVSVRSITSPIGKIVNNIQKIKKGQYDLKKIKDTSSELTVLCDAFDEMAHSIEGYVTSIEERAKLERQLLEKENENLKINELLIQTELKVLQGQINPHFLFNSLSMIAKMGYIEQAHKTTELIETTADLLRYSLDKASKTSNLTGELESVQNYLTIQRCRFGDRVAFEFSVEDGLPNIRLPGMIVQPIIENAVIHGIANMVQGAIISVRVSRRDECIEITVDDNGDGIEPQRLEKIISGAYPGEEGDGRSSSIGIYNVRRRLEMFFGSRQVLFIESSAGCGTSVTLSLPIQDGGFRNV